VAPAALEGWGVVNRGKYFVDQLRWRLHGAHGDTDSFRDPIPVADLSLARRTVGQMFLVARGTFGALDQILQAQMG
jgi:hypothetical protein